MRMVFQSRTPILLTMGDYHGTLAAARCLGQEEVQVFLADNNSCSLTSTSRHVGRLFRTKDPVQHKAFAQNLIEIGQRNPGMVLYATSDDIAWMMAKKQGELNQYFKLYQAPESAVCQILNKDRLYRVAKDLNIPVPQTWSPTNFEQLDSCMDQLSFPVILKPRSQIGRPVGIKGLLCHDRAELLKSVKAFLERSPHADETLGYEPDMCWPLIQKFYPEAASDTYSLAGFIPRDSNRIVVRASRKAIQQPVRIGNGLAFEAEEVHPKIRDQILTLCKNLGYFGVFEAEFIRSTDQDSYLLMDFNPRFYGQMGFEVFRELPLPLMVYLGATDQNEALDEVLNRAEQWDDRRPYLYSFRCKLKIILITQFLGGKLSFSEVRSWMKLLGGEQNVLATKNGSDRGPFRTYVRQLIWQMLRHPRSSFYHYFR